MNQENIKKKDKYVTIEDIHCSSIPFDSFIDDNDYKYEVEGMKRETLILLMIKKLKLLEWKIEKMNLMN